MDKEEIEVVSFCGSVSVSGKQASSAFNINCKYIILDIIQEKSNLYLEPFGLKIAYLIVPSPPPPSRWSIQLYHSFLYSVLYSTRLIKIARANMFFTLCAKRHLSKAFSVMNRQKMN